ncbi:MAG: hypothetical protein EBE86_000605 [Hormoscilla sp. GUM202]|nr:hypothetical protein [Hormoscilla sp. GUM202]
MTTSTPIQKAIATASHQRAIATEILEWQPATWEDYVTYRDADIAERVRLFFYRGQLLIDMGSEGINHSSST